MLSRALLAVLLPMVLLSSLHLHTSQAEYAGEVCTDCVQHHCVGHVGQLAQPLHDCVICQFMSLPMLAAAIVAIVLTNGICKRCVAPCRTDLPVLALGIIVTRGPPAV